MGWSTVRSRFFMFLRPLSMSASGASLLWAIAAITILGAFAAAITSISPSSMQEKLAGERSAEAYYAAMSGLSYAKNMATLAAAGTYGEGWVFSSLNGTYPLGNNTSFVLAVTGNASPYTVSSRGVVQTGTANEANYQTANAVSYTPYTAPPPPEPPNLGDYNFINPSNRTDYAAYSTDQTRDIPTALDDSDITTKNFVVGKDYKYGFGNIWFTGNRGTVSTLGVSDFTKGFRLFFTFKFTTNIGDGFVVAVLNAASNNYGSSGGDSAEGGLLGYAGDSRFYNSSDGGWAPTVKEYVDSSGLGTKGLIPPKFGVEIDTYVNASNDSWDPTDKVAKCVKADNDFMNDLAGTKGGHHVGYDYWGTDKAYLRRSCNGPGVEFEGNLKRYSDVRHGMGDGTVSNASNKASGNSALEYFPFSTNTTYYFRMDVKPTNNDYTIDTWVGTCNVSKTTTQAQCDQQVYGSTSSHTGSLSDTQKDFVDDGKRISLLKKVYITDTLKLTTAQKAQFKNFMWGITSGSGDATQQIDFRNIGLSLR